MNNRNQTLWLAYLGLSLMSLIIGLSFIFVKIGLRSADSYDLLAHRFSAAFVALILLRAIGVIKVEKMAGREWISVMGVALFYPVLCFTFQTIGLEYSSASQAGILFALLPVLTLIAGTIFLKERSSIPQWGGVVLSLAGLLYIAINSRSGANESSIIGVVLLLLSILSMVAYYMVGKKIMRKYSSMTLTSAMIFIGFSIFNLIALLRHAGAGSINNFFDPLTELSFLISVLYLGVLSSLLTSFLSNFALSRISTAQVSIFNNISPLIAVAGGVLFLGEEMSVSQIIGGVAVLIGVLLVLINKK